MIKRYITEQIVEKLFTGKVIILYGARQVGKTTLCKTIQAQVDEKVVRLDGDDLTTREYLGSQKKETILNFIGGGKKILIIDEAQRIPHIGICLKIIHDHMPEVQVIATGSSSFDIAQHIQEPLTGRNIVFNLHPLSIQELIDRKDTPFIIQQKESYMLYGMYPEIIMAGDTTHKLQHIKRIANDYVFKDVLTIDGIRNHDSIVKLLQLLALQIGQEVSYHELGQQVGLSLMTVRKYIRLLEQSFVIFEMGGWSQNLRKEITKNKKIYFWDLGIRNALIQDFRPLDLRVDKGNMRENFVIAERKKFLLNNHADAQNYFWRTYDQQEIDYLEHHQGQIAAYEIKQTKTSHQPPTGFAKSYPDASFTTINQDNVWSRLT